MCGEAHGGHDAIEKAHRLHPDLIILDLSMPVMNGLDAARTLNRRTSQVNSVKRAQYAFVFTGLMRKTYDTAHPHAHRNLFSNWF